MTRFAKVFALVMCLLLAVAATVSAKADVKEPKLIGKDKHDYVYTAPDGIADKEAYEASIADFDPFAKKNDVAPDVTVMYTQYLSGTNYKYITPPGGTNGKIDAYFNDTLTYNLCCHGSFSGDSHTRWLGSSPYNANTVTLADKWTFKGVAVTVGVSGSGWSLGGSSTARTATWQASVSNNWKIDHYYNGVTFDGADVWASHDATGDYKFGTSYYTINAYDSTWL